MIDRAIKRRTVLAGAAAGALTVPKLMWDDAILKVSRRSPRHQP